VQPGINKTLLMGIVESQRSGESVDGILGNKVRVIQALKGYRVSEDAIILTWFARPIAHERIMDAGTGCGVIAFGMAIREPSIMVVGIEIQKDLAHRAARGARLNGLDSRVLIVRGDVTNADRFFRHGTFDMVVSNPPYYEPGRGRINLEHEKALSRHQLMMPIPLFLDVSGRLLRKDGRLCIIYPASAAGGIGNVLKETGFRMSRMLWIHPHEGAPAGHVCMELLLTGGMVSVSEEHLFLYDQSHRRTPYARAILAGDYCSG
jgi:tRNA1Val (adenine37-N6)-methyltransferase